MIALALLCSVVAAAVAESRTASEVLPPSIVIYVEIPRPYDVLSAVYDHKVVARVESLDQVRAAMEKKPYLDFKAGVALVESQMGLPWRKIVEQATGVTSRADPVTTSPLLLPTRNISVPLIRKKSS